MTLLRSYRTGAGVVGSTVSCSKVSLRLVARKLHSFSSLSSAAHDESPERNPPDDEQSDKWCPLKSSCLRDEEEDEGERSDAVVLRPARCAC